MIRKEIELLRKDWDFLRKLRRTSEWYVEEVYFDGLLMNTVAIHQSGIYFSYQGPKRIPYFYCDKYGNPVYFRTPFLLMAFLMHKHIRRIHIMHLLGR